MTTDELRKLAEERADKIIDLVILELGPADEEERLVMVRIIRQQMLKFGAIIARECLDGHGLIDPHGETAIREIAEALEREDA